MDAKTKCLNEIKIISNCKQIPRRMMSFYNLTVFNGNIAKITVSGN